jgi:serine phosphatase RsbU (regulator of sigma subunit)
LKNFFCFIFLFSLHTLAQNAEIDSLLKVLPSQKNDTNKVKTLNQLSVQHRIIGSFEKALEFAGQALELSKNVTVGKTRGWPMGEGAALQYTGIVYANQGNYPEALKNFLASLQIREKIGDRRGVAISLNNMGNVYHIQGNYQEALKNQFAALKIREEIGDKNGIAGSLNNIGLIYDDQGNYSEALKNNLASLKIREDIGDKNGIAISLNNIGNIYSNQGNYSEALKNHLATLKIFEELGSKNGIATSLNNIGNVNLYQSNYSEALKYFLASLKISEEIGDKKGTAMSLGNLGDAYTKIGKAAEGKNYILQSLVLSKETGAMNLIKDSYISLAKADSALGNYQSAFESYKLYIIYRDSLLNEENTKKTIQQQMQYEFDKKEALTQAEQDKKDALALEEIGKQKMQRNGFIGGFALMLLLAGVSYRSFRNKNKANGILAHKNKIIEEKQKEVIDSINYAKRIQAAILPPLRMVKEHVPDSFILYKPKDIVAGDFYWLEEKNGNILFAAADCTGHGVPGAMVSVICNNGLNRSVREHGITDPGKILDKTREIVIQEFEKSDDEVKDGMDISLCSLHGNTLRWSGANNPLWIIRNHEVIEMKPDKQPIGKYAEYKPFSTHTLELQKGDILYIFTDGYADQFGGEKGKKFKYSKLKELLLSTQNESMDRQKEILNDAFESWKGSLEQVDDVCVIGVRI